jgi:hypothetical protein
MPQQDVVKDATGYKCMVNQQLIVHSGKHFQEGKPFLENFKAPFNVLPD